ncbi:MAG: phosphoribosyltransferase [Euzebyales bacterium]|jgi:putative phosphoribosyl transferase|nr:phosphoribosyltransferase [Euzebyales bacterium]
MATRMQVFEDRQDAGRRLATALSTHPEVEGAERIVVLGVPRGGLPVGAEVARALRAPFDVVVVRKLRSPHNQELGFGAIGADGHVEVNDDLVARLGLSTAEIEQEIADRRDAVGRRVALYREAAAPADLEGAVAIVVDDGIATGGTARLACAYARRNGARRVLLAAPVGPAGVTERMADAADAVLVLSTPAEFLSVGQAYADFAQLSDTDAVTALRVAAGPAA